MRTILSENQKIITLLQSIFSTHLNHQILTAILGILNKHAVALATDSATTLTSARGEKIYNNANKLFNLSLHHPVGLMICNSAELSGIPWETIIKIYRKQLAATRFDRLPDYAEDFVNYIQSSVANEFDSEDQIRSMALLMTDLTAYTIQQVIDLWQFNAPPAGADLNAIANAQMLQQFIPSLLAAFRDAPVITATA